MTSAGDGMTSANDEMTSADDEPGVVVLGTELAAARAAQERHRPPGPSPLGVAYDHAAYRCWRWVESSVDATIAAFVHRFVAATPDERAVLRDRLTMDDFYALLSFARRRAFAAIRTGDAALIVEAFDALSTVDLKRVDYRDVGQVACLVAGAAAYGSTRARDAAAGAIARATPGVARWLRVSMARDDVDLIGAAGYRVADTPGGRVLVEDGRERFHPDRDLIQSILWLAEAIEQEGTYVVNTVTVAGRLPSVWLDPAAASLTGPALHRLTGCVNLSGHRGPAAGDGGSADRGSPGRNGEADHDHLLMVWLAEAATPADATVIADAATRAQDADRVILGVADGRRVAVLVNRNAWAGRAPLEDPERVLRFRPLLAHALALG